MSYIYTCGICHTEVHIFSRIMKRSDVDKFFVHQRDGLVNIVRVSELVGVDRFRVYFSLNVEY